MFCPGLNTALHTIIRKGAYHKGDVREDLIEAAEQVLQGATMQIIDGQVAFDTGNGSRGRWTPARQIVPAFRR